MSDAGAAQPRRDAVAGPGRGVRSEQSDTVSDAGVRGPLAGWRVLVPRPAARADELIDLLRRAGAEPLHVPLIDTRPLPDSPEVRSAAADLAAGTFDWVSFTSAAAVTAMLQAARRIGADRPIGGSTRVAAVGPATAEALRRAGIRVDLVPGAPGSAAALVAAWPSEPMGRRVLLPRSDLARPELPNALRATGYRVREVCAYHTVTLPVPASIAREITAGTIDAILLTSPSVAGALTGTPIAPRSTVVAIGRPTAVAAAEAGISVTATGLEPSAAGLLEALTSIARMSRSGPP